MNIFILAAILVGVFAFIDVVLQNSSNLRGNIKINIAFIGICAIILFISVFREPFIGVDSLDNYNAFNQILRDSSFAPYEIGYNWFVRFFQKITTNYIWYIRVCAILIDISFFFVVRKMRYRSLILMLFLLGELNSTFDIIKGFLSFSLILLGWYVIFKKEEKKGYVLVVLSCFIHLSSIIFLPLFLFGNKIKKKSTYLILFIVCVLICLTPIASNILNFIVNHMGKISYRFMRYQNIVGKEKDFSFSYLILYSIPIFLLMKNVQVKLGMDLKNNNYFLNYDKLNSLGNICYLVFILAIVSINVPVLHRYLKLSLIFTYIFECSVIERIRIKENRTVLIILFILINFLFCIINNGGFEYNFYFKKLISY